MDRKIIVFGATGGTGIKICEALGALSIPHAAFVRKGSEHKVKTKLTEIYQGDVFQKKDILKAITSESFTDIIIALGSRDLKGGNIRSTGTKNIVDALKENSAKSKLHIVSAHGVGESWNGLRWYEKLFSKLFISKAMKDHEKQEQYAKTNPGGYHIIRPVGLRNGPSTGHIHHQKKGHLPHSDIARADVAKFLIESMFSNKSGEVSISRE